MDQIPSETDSCWAA